MDTKPTTAENSTKEPKPLRRSFDAILTRLREANEDPDQIERDRKRAADYEAREHAKRVGKAADTLRRTIPQRYLTATLGTFEAATGTPQAAVKRKAYQLANQIDRVVAERRNLLFLGPVGTGKDHLAVALLKAAALAGHVAEWHDTRRLYVQIADSYTRRQPQEAIYTALAAPAVICLSDPIDSRNWTPAKADALAKIITR